MSERHLTQIEIDEMWYRVERRLREKGLTLAVFVTADGRPMVHPPVELPEERKARRPNDRVAELEAEIAELKRAYEALLKSAPAASDGPKRGTLLGSIEALLGSSSLSIDEIAAGIREKNRERVYYNVAQAVHRGKLVRIGRGRDAKYAVRSHSAP